MVVLPAEPVMPMTVRDSPAACAGRTDAADCLGGKRAHGQHGVLDQDGGIVDAVRPGDGPLREDQHCTAAEGGGNEVVAVRVLARFRDVERAGRGFARIRDHRQRGDPRIGVQAAVCDFGDFRRSKCNHLGLGLYPVVLENGESPGCQGVPEFHPVIEGKIDSLDLLPDLVSAAGNQDGVLRAGQFNGPLDGGVARDKSLR